MTTSGPTSSANHAPDGPTVLWENISGRFIHFKDYRCSIKMDRPAKVARDGSRRRCRRSPTPSSRKPCSPPWSASADWQLANPSRHKPTDWTQGAGDTGIMALAGISADPKYRDAMV